MPSGCLVGSEQEESRSPRLSSPPSTPAPEVRPSVVTPTTPDEVSPPRPGQKASASFAIVFPRPLDRRRPEPPQDNRSGCAPDSMPLLVAPHPPEVSPRQQPYRVTAALAFSPSGCPPACAASPRRRRRSCPRPQDLAPLPSPWRRPVLPPDSARSSLGLAYQIDPDPGANRRPGWPQGTRPKAGPAAAARIQQRKPLLDRMRAAPIDPLADA